MSEKKLKETGLKPLGRIINYADAETEPIDFCLSPAKSGKLALKKAGMKI